VASWISQGVLKGATGATGATGPAGPSSVSANANNKATLGSDSLLLVQGVGSGVAATTHAQTVSGDDPQLTNARTPTAHQSTHNAGSDAIPLATASGQGLCPAVDNTTIGIVSSKLTAILAGILALINAAAGLLNTAMFYKSTTLGTVATNQTVDCVNAVGVVISVGINTTFAFTLNLTHLAIGVPVTLIFTNSGTATVSLQIACTQPGGTAYNSVIWKTSTGTINMTTVGIAVTAGQSVIGMGASSPIGTWQLVMVAN